MKETRNSKPRYDLTNQRFGKLIALEYIKGGNWKCKCDCEKEIITSSRNLRTGHTKSCGCLRAEKAKNNVYDMSNYETENIKVLKRNGSDNQQVALWDCLCKKCGNVFTTRGSSIRAGYINSCGCIHSINEQNITQLLIKNNIQFATQYTFSDLLGVGGKPLRFDFAIFNNNKLSHLIEYNGSQHYIKPNGVWGESFDNLIKNDKLKEEYCKQNNIPLVIIPYNYQYDIKDLIFLEPVETISG